MKPVNWRRRRHPGRFDPLTEQHLAHHTIPQAFGGAAWEAAMISGCYIGPRSPQPPR
ncbi:hypothetical protein [Pseudactinotalea sp. HY158]|uniref:hypothetical protein n=1 Tax=Pseudactinotalea sp. HY158 TaxID=2654547 RepID=UPI00129D0FAF|nr:hypothetical protein [Pseudactinotalea sp. HY158]QGH70270.1 hypothetical protein GCE65_12770 [Pseudactinotalea sp. HY158]